VVEGVSKKALDTGAGHYPTTPLPGEPGNVAIAGHRNTFGKPFADLDRLQQGDKVILETPIGTHTYEMVPAFDNHPNPWVVEPSDLTVLNPTSEPYLTLTTCHPRGSAKQRLIARLALVESVSRSVDGAA
jgi:sortase A